jgi:RNA polymerase sigma-70 factor (ECF subfamily)
MRKLSSIRTMPQVDDTVDRDLIDRVAKGDTEAFTALYQRYLPRLRAYLSKHLGTEACIDEVCQDTLMVIWQRAADLYPTTRVSSWIFGIARRQARTIWSRGLSAAVAPPPAPEPEGDPMDPEAHLMLQEHRHAVAQILATLPEPQRTVLTLAYYEEASYQDIAARLSCSVDTVKTRLRQARQRLAAQIAQRRAV